MKEERNRNLNSLVAAKPVKLVKELQHRSLNFTITALLRVETLGTNSIQFVDEDDGGGLLFGKFESVPNQLRTVTNEHLHQ